LSAINGTRTLNTPNPSQVSGEKSRLGQDNSPAKGAEQ
jgi:hypothetical protein